MRATGVYASWNLLGFFVGTVCECACAFCASAASTRGGKRVQHGSTLLKHTTMNIQKVIEMMIRRL